MAKTHKKVPTRDVLTEYAQMQQKMLKQMKESVEEYDQYNPKDRLILRLTATVSELTSEVNALYGAKTAWMVEIEELRNRLEDAEKKIMSLERKITTNVLDNELTKFKNHVKIKKSKSKK